MVLAPPTPVEIKTTNILEVLLKNKSSDGITSTIYILNASASLYGTVSTKFTPEAGPYRKV